jgi:hypothetical protein
MNSPDDFIIYFRLHKIIKVFLFIFIYFIPAIFLQARPREYNARSHVHIKTHGLPRNRKSTTCTICWLKSVLREEKRRTGSDSEAANKRINKKTCRTSSDIGADRKIIMTDEFQRRIGKGYKWYQLHTLNSFAVISLSNLLPRAVLSYCMVLLHC